MLTLALVTDKYTTYPLDKNKILVSDSSYAFGLFFITIELLTPFTLKQPQNTELGSGFMKNSFVHIYTFIKIQYHIHMYVQDIVRAIKVRNFGHNSVSIRLFLATDAKKFVFSVKTLILFALKF